MSYEIENGTNPGFLPLTSLKDGEFGVDHNSFLWLAAYQNEYVKFTEGAIVYNEACDEVDATYVHPVNVKIKVE